MFNVLVVDDDQQIVKMIEACLAPQGYRVMHAYDGQDGLQKALKHLPNLIIVDIMMPVMDGPTFIGQLRLELTNRVIPVIFLTGLVGKSEEKTQNNLIGNEFFLAKPFSTAALIALAKRVLGQ